MVWICEDDGDRVERCLMSEVSESKKMGCLRYGVKEEIRVFVCPKQMHRFGVN